MRFRKKPVIIDAEKWQGPDTDLRVITDHGGSYIPTLEGLMFITEGDWIIKGVKGELYPCKPDIFEMTYEPAEEVLKADV